MEGSKLYILWTGKDKEQALKVVIRYIENVINKKQWTAVELLLWGPSEQLVADDQEVKDKVLSLIQKGVFVRACSICADEYGVSEPLVSMGIKLDDIGDLLTQIIKQEKAFVSL